MVCVRRMAKRPSTTSPCIKVYKIDITVEYITWVSNSQTASMVPYNYTFHNLTRNLKTRIGQGGISFSFQAHCGSLVKTSRVYVCDGGALLVQKYKDTSNTWSRQKMNTSTIFILGLPKWPKKGTYDDNFAPSCATTLGVESPKAFKPPSAKK